MAGTPVRRVAYYRDYAGGPLDPWKAARRADLEVAVPPAPPPVAGAIPLGGTAYAIPTSGVIWLSKTGNDANSGADLANAKATITGATDAVANGGTIVVDAGDYEQKRNSNLGKTCTIQAAPGAVVNFDGSSVISGWTAGSGVWTRTSTVEWDHSDAYVTGGSSNMTDSQNPVAAWPDQVFYDGVPMWQVAAGVTPGPMQFSVNYTTDVLTIGSNPSGHEIRQSVRDTFLILANKVTLRGIGVRRYATSLPQAGCVNIVQAGAGSQVENCVFTDAGLQAISANGDGTRVNNCTIIRPGMVGIHTNASVNLRIENNVIEDANINLFKPAPSAAGMKIHRSTNPIIRNNIIRRARRCAGIWFDQDNYNVQIINNLIVDGVGTGGEVKAAGIIVEASEFAVLFSNRVYGGAGKYKACIMIQITGHARVFNNWVEGSTQYDIGMVQDHRRGTAPIDYIIKQTEVCNNVFSQVPGSPSSLFQCYALDRESGIPADAMISIISGNVFSATKKTLPLESNRMMGWGLTDNTTTTIYKTPLALSSSKGPSWVNTLTASDAPNDAELASLAVTAVPLPADIAAMVGIVAGTKIVGPPLPAPVPTT